MCVPVEQRGIMRETPWGYMSYIDYRQRIEFGHKEYEQIEVYCGERRIPWTASCWDEPSFDFISGFGVGFHKVPSACVTDLSLLRYMKQTDLLLVISTGGSDMGQIGSAVLETTGCENRVLLHACSAYPSEPSQLNLHAMDYLRRAFFLPVGYSGHESSIAPTLAAVALGARVIERHITLDRSMWGTDQAASLGPRGLHALVRDIRLVEEALGDGCKRVMPSEIPVMAKLRRFK